MDFLSGISAYFPNQFSQNLGLASLHISDFLTRYFPSKFSVLFLRKSIFSPAVGWCDPSRNTPNPNTFFPRLPGPTTIHPFPLVTHPSSQHNKRSMERNGGAKEAEKVQENGEKISGKNRFLARMDWNNLGALNYDFLTFFLVKIEYDFPVKMLTGTKVFARLKKEEHLPNGINPGKHLFDAKIFCHFGSPNLL